MEIIKKIRVLLRKIFFYKKLKVNGLHFIVPTIFRISPDLFLDEPWMIDYVRKICAIKKGTFIDVGVNLGQTLVKVKSIDPLQKYVGFEANPICFHYAQEVARVNKFENTILVPVGLSDKTDIVQLFFDYAIDCQASLICDPGKNKNSSRVAVFEGDKGLGSLGIDNVSVIKIDVEGSELEVLKGLNSTIITQRPFIIIEILNSKDVCAAAKVEEVFNFFFLNQYEEFCINEKNYLFSPKEVGFIFNK